jgi:hypothetical protein
MMTTITKTTIMDTVIQPTLGAHMIILMQATSTSKGKNMLTTTPMLVKSMTTAMITHIQVIRTIRATTFLKLVIPMNTPTTVLPTSTHMMIMDMPMILKSLIVIIIQVK